MLFDPKWEVQAPANQPSEPWRQTLLDAADDLEHNGWCRGSLQNGSGQHCILGVLYVLENFIEARDAFKRYLGVRDLINWNDNPGRTAEEVILKLRDCAAR